MLDTKKVHSRGKHASMKRALVPEGSRRRGKVQDGRPSIFSLLLSKWAATGIEEVPQLIQAWFYVYEGRD